MTRSLFQVVDVLYYTNANSVVRDGFFGLTDKELEAMKVPSGATLLYVKLNVKMKIEQVRHHRDTMLIIFYAVRVQSNIQTPRSRSLETSFGLLFNVFF